MTTFDFQEKVDKVLKALVLLGIWRIDGPLTRIDGLRIALLTLVFNLLNVAQILSFFFCPADLAEKMLSLLITLTGLFSNVKLIYLMRYKKSIQRLRNSVNRKSFQPRNEKQKNMAKRTFKILDFIYFNYRLGPLSAICMFGVLPLVHEPELRRLPYLTWYPYDFKRTAVYAITSLHQVLVSFWASQIYVNVDSLNFTLLAIIKTQYDILEDDLKNLSEEDGTGFGKEYMKACLVKSISHHKEILSLTEEVFNMLNVNVFGQFAMSTGSICLLLLQLATADFGVKFLAIIFYVFSFFGELFLYCWFANEVTLASKAVPTAAFESNWTDGSSALKKNIVYFIHRTQTPVELYAIGVFKVDLSNFLAILRHSYSGYTLLSQVNKKYTDAEP